MNPLDWLAESSLQMLFPGLWLIPREVAIAAGPWNELLTLADDKEYFVRVLLQAQRVLFCPGARAYYRSGVPSSLSGRKNRGAWQSAYNVTSASGKTAFGSAVSLPPIGSGSHTPPIPTMRSPKPPSIARSIWIGPWKSRPTAVPPSARKGHAELPRIEQNTAGGAHIPSRVRQLCLDFGG
jgi:hypothetical protein